MAPVQTPPKELEILPQLAQLAARLPDWEDHELQREYNASGGLQVITITEPEKRSLVCRPMQCDLIKQLLKAEASGAETDTERKAIGYVRACVVRKEDQDWVIEKGALVITAVYSHLVKHWSGREVKVETMKPEAILGDQLETHQALADTKELFGFQLTDTQSGRKYNAVLKRPTTRAIFLAQQDHADTGSHSVLTRSLVRECFVGGDALARKLPHLCDQLYDQLDPLIDIVNLESEGF